MAEHDRFPPGVAERLRFYVYRLIDPRNGETFYVGKGKGNRVFQHARGAIEKPFINSEEDEVDANCSAYETLELRDLASPMWCIDMASAAAEGLSAQEHRARLLRRMALRRYADPHPPRALFRGP